MKMFPTTPAFGCGLLVISTHALGAHADPAAPINTMLALGFIILIVAVGLGVFFMRSRDPKQAPLTAVLGDEAADPHAVNPDTTVKDCVVKMKREKIGAVLVLEGEKLVGIFTERDALNRVLAAGIDPSRTKVTEVMTKDPTVIAPNTTVGEAMEIVTRKHIRHLPITQNENVLGIVSSGDLTHWVVKDEIKEIQHLVDIAERP